MKRQLNVVQKDLIVSHRAVPTADCPCPSGASFSSALKFLCVFLTHHICSGAVQMLVRSRANPQGMLWGYGHHFNLGVNAISLESVLVFLSSKFSCGSSLCFSVYKLQYLKCKTYRKSLNFTMCSTFYPSNNRTVSLIRSFDVLHHYLAI